MGMQPTELDGSATGAVVELVYSMRGSDGLPGWFPCTVPPATSEEASYDSVQLFRSTRKR